MLVDTLIVVKYLIFKIIKCPIYFSIIRQFHNFYLRKVRRTIIIKYNFFCRDIQITSSYAMTVLNSLMIWKSYLIVQLLMVVLQLAWVIQQMLASSWLVTVKYKTTWILRTSMMMFMLSNHPQKMVSKGVWKNLSR